MRWSLYVTKCMCWMHGLYIHGQGNVKLCCTAMPDMLLFTQHMMQKREKIVREDWRCQKISFCLSRLQFFVSRKVIVKERERGDDQNAQRNSHWALKPQTHYTKKHRLHSLATTYRVMARLEASHIFVHLFCHHRHILLTHMQWMPTFLFKSLWWNPDAVCPARANAIRVRELR